MSDDVQVTRTEEDSEVTLASSDSESAQDADQRDADEQNTPAEEPSAEEDTSDQSSADENDEDDVDADNVDDEESVELDERKRYIEVKTTISSKPLHFNKIHLTPNEWNTASTLKDRYYVYRLMISKTEKKLFLIQDPVGLYKKDLIDMIPKDGADITFSTNKADVGNFEELLTWVS